MANKLPQTIGEDVYAAQDGVFVYKDANLDSEKLGNVFTGGDKVFNKNAFIGSYNGVKNGSFLQLTVSYQVKALFITSTKTVSAWVLGSQVTTEIQETLIQQDEKKNEDLEKYLADITGDADTKKSLSGSGSGEGSGTSSLSTTNIVLGFALITAIGLIIAGFVKRNSKAKN
ncbi:hypothetical protein [Emticicia sp. BO119]|uniref:hypothetical protein n=1 Tax=Emticicia sp. BO119 TaxID=2757768 RepID=UPI0015F0575F|nr:hypothetical protein [Emticicia sp. BO119]MBA4849503.1 hypothetical protein [Emticicia sp. BO119]